MNTITQTYTRTDIRIVFENFRADLEMLARRTQAMPLGYAREYAHDIRLMAQEKCLGRVHVQLYDANQNRVKVHQYSVREGILSDSQRPGDNRWPCMPQGMLCVLIEYSHIKKWEKLKSSGQLKIKWSPSGLSTDYSGMRNNGTKLYSSNNYGWERDTFVN